MARKVLLADASIAVQKAVEATLEPRDFEIFSVTTGQAAIDEAKTIIPDVILLDTDLQDANGYEICRKIKDDPELIGIPVILMAAEGEEVSQDRVEQAGAQALLTKPFQEKALMDHVFTLVDTSFEDTVKIESSEMEVLDFGEEGETLEEDVGALELEDDDILELTETADSLEEEEEVAAAADVEETPQVPDQLESTQEIEEEFPAEFTLEDEGEMNLEIQEEATGEPGQEPLRTTEEISFDEELEEFDIEELAEGEPDRILPLADEVDVSQVVEEDQGFEQAEEEGIEFDLELEEERDLGELEESTEIDLSLPPEMQETVSLDVEEVMTSQETSGLDDTEELEEISLDEELDKGLIGLEEAGEPALEASLRETDDDLSKAADTWLVDTEEEPVLEEAPPPEQGPLEGEPGLQETSIEQGETFESELALEEELIQEGETGLRETAIVDEIELDRDVSSGLIDTDILGEEIRPSEISDTSEQETQVAYGEEEMGVQEPIPALEEVPLETDVSPFAADTGALEGEFAPELQELSMEEVPSLEEGHHLELSEEDFFLLDPVSEESLRAEISSSLQETVEKILSDMAPPIVERVAREIALERAEQLIREEIKLTKPPAE